MEHRETLETFIEAVTRSKTTSEWLQILDESGLPFAAVNDIRATLSHEQGKKVENTPEADLIVLARDMIQEVAHPACGQLKLVNTPIKFSFSEPGIRMPPPLLGQHTDEILRDVLKMSEDVIQQLRDDGVVS